MEASEKILGSILGCAIGDALGAATEGADRRQIAQRYGQLRDFSQIDEYYESIIERKDIPTYVKKRILSRRKLPGLYTDDTQQALLLAESLIDKNGTDLGDFAGKITTVVKKTKSRGLPMGAFRGTGSGFKEVVRRLLSGIKPEDAGVESAGNGAAMRICPVGLFFRDNPKEAGIKAGYISTLTHKDVRGVLAASSVAIAISLATQRNTITKTSEFFQDIIEVLISIKPRISELNLSYDEQKADQFIGAMKNLKKHLPDSYERAANAVAKFANRYSEFPVGEGSAFCLCSVVISYWHFLHHVESTEEAIISAVNAGGDTDTIAAIVGSMIGALRGVNSIPSQWLFGLKNKKQIELRAMGLIERRKDFADWQEFSDMELFWTKKMIELRKQSEQIVS